MVNKIKNILVPLDGSKNSLRGLDNAIYLARQSHSMITGIFVMPIAPVSAFSPVRFSITAMKKDAKRILESAKTKAAKKGILFNSKILCGDPGGMIVRFAHRKKGKFDLIVIGSRGLGVFTAFFFGSTSNYVLHKSKIPVLVVK